MEIKILVPSSESDVEALRNLGYEYLATLSKNMITREYFESQNFQLEIDKMPSGFERPNGICLLAYVNNESAGTVAVRRIDANTCEMKRLFVKPKFQGMGLGRQLAERVMAEAKDLGYTKMRLDTSRSAMAAGISLYQSMGFYEIAPYNDNFIVDAIFMEKILD
ncbi:GNAT family N-acetyltransferase [Chryseolinea sp. H1M3-3]|uniref:GNAT family N-acetyltransferase n=1 Tax=Chryseolinea sp. H1M3-3 TaxID=3034144 RepID=UPI0023EDB363|nr:GNAT family N-acetyltransferase [Chryseolinea sp. H1M3-3]